MLRRLLNYFCHIVGFTVEVAFERNVLCTILLFLLQSVI